MRTGLKTALALTTLTAALASCGVTATPTGTQGQMVKLHLGLGGPAGTMSAQGVPTGGFSTANLHLKVKVATSAGTPVTFKSGVYAPDGSGDSAIILNMANGFGADLLLPAGEYTFETVGKDGPTSSATTGTLLAYSKTNPTLVDVNSPRVKLNVHAVMNTDASTLSFARPTDTVYTNDLLDLRLNVRTNAVGEQRFSVPTTDYTIGTYAVTNGTLNARTASKLGASVLATGTVSDPSVRVSVPVTAWMQTGPETAALRTTTVNFEHAVVLNNISADVAAPTATLSDSALSSGTAATVTGTAQDEGGAIGEARLYDGTTLIASSVTDDQNEDVTALTFEDGSTVWNAAWTPMTTGARELTLIVSDVAGNETTVNQTVTVKDPEVRVAASTNPSVLRVTLRAGETRAFRYDIPDLSQTPRYYIEQYMINANLWENSQLCYDTPTFTVTATDTATGEVVPLPRTYGQCYQGTYTQVENGTSYSGEANARRALTFTVTNLTSADLVLNPYFKIGQY